MRIASLCLAVTLCVAALASTPRLRPAPDLPEGDWLNTPGNKPITMKSLRGKVVLVEFWTFE